MHSRTFQLERIATPLGQMLLVTDAEQRLRALDWQDYEDRLLLLLRRQYKAHGGGPESLQETAQASPARGALQAYFEGDIHAIDHLAVATGGTDFQREVWMALRHIPAGQPVSYRSLAERIGRPAAVRAVGMANGANPIGIVVPCHRIIGSNASLTGYAAGLHRKQWLLQHEQRHGGQLAQSSLPFD